MRMFVALVAVVSVCLFSCQQEIEDNNTNTPESVDSAYIRSVVFLDTTLPAGADTISKSFFTYDNNKRVLKALTYSIGAIDTTIYEFRYNAQDTLPYLILDKSVNYNGPGTLSLDSTFYTYSSNIVIKDSSVVTVFPGNVYDGTTVLSFATINSPVKLYVREYMYIGSVLTSINFDSVIYATSTSSGSISSQAKTGGGLGFYNTVQAGFDTKNNPYKKILKFKKPCYENMPFGDWFFQANNPLQVQVDQFWVIDNLLYTYKYRNDGYPTSSTCFSANNSAGYNKVLYFYTTL